MNELLLLENSALKIWYLLQKADTRGRSCSVNLINKDRSTLGEFHHLYHQLRNDPEKFHAYFRMTIPTFDYILDKIQDRLLKKWTNFNRQPINPTERLVITLR